MQTTSGQWDSKRAHEIITEHAGMPGALIPMLHALQHAFGYIDKSAVTPIAAALNLSNADVHGVITFYHDFRDAPGGKHQLQVCGAEACQACGCRELMTHATEKLGVQPGETTPDGMFTLNTVYCLGNCALSPAISIDGRMYGKVDANRFDQLIDTCKAS
ncbi:MAG: formate dehydrogenase subunit gamma [Gammaproteobacteria bacterium]|nr:formate dehydrogenase subunit gamma [Gammaproteobacteria bacterium]